MSLSSQPNFSELQFSNVKELLLFLYKLAKSHSIPFSSDDELLATDERSLSQAKSINTYQYNYEYINQLAITDASQKELFNLPKLILQEERPSLKWLSLVVSSLVTLAINNILSDSPLFSEEKILIQDKDESLFAELADKLKTLEESKLAIKATKNREELKNVVGKVAAIAKETSDRLVVNLPSNLALKIANNAGIDAELKEIDAEFESYKLTQKTAKASPSFLPRNFGEDSTTELLTISLKNLIKQDVKLWELERSLIDDTELTERTSATFPNLDDYDKLFTKKIALPAISTRFQEDLVFAYMQVAGPNPLMLEKATEQDALLISNEQYQQILGEILGYTSDSLKAALSEGRLYKADYSLLAGMQNGNFPDAQKYSYAPFGLFAVPPASSPSRSLVPLAIQCQPSVENNPVFTILDGDNWMSAKTVLQMADSNYHEIVSHLGRTHLVIEPFVTATKGYLPATHPLRMLLEPHLEGTMLINYGAHQSLIAPGGGVDKLLASTIEDDAKLTVKAAQSYLQNFNDEMFPKILQRRGVDNAQQLPEYPYRDDGLLIWTAIRTWVRAYLSSHYTSDRIITSDNALQAWASVLVSPSGGRLQKFGEDESGAIKTLDYLVDAVSNVIFTASAQHAAVNFPQGQLMTYPPTFPLACYAPAPTNRDVQVNFLSLLPAIERSKDQLQLVYLLGSVYYTQLGKYSRSSFATKVSTALRAFQNQLKGIEQQINKKNSSSVSRLLPYEFLLPSKIPQSINI